jgi:hypothetical protein
VWFTDDFDKQWGDDWNDAPYEHNAGRPYTHETKPVMYLVQGDYILPDDGYLNSPYSVQSINRRAVAWLRHEGEHSWRHLFGGDDFESFESFLLSTNGRIVCPQERDE